MKSVLLLIAALTACGPAIYSSRILGKQMNVDGSAWERWRGPNEPVPYPAYVLLASVDRACLVDEETFYQHAQVGVLFACAWRYQIKSRHQVFTVLP